MLLRTPSLLPGRKCLSSVITHPSTKSDILTHVSINLINTNFFSVWKQARQTVAHKAIPGDTDSCIAHLLLNYPTQLLSLSSSCCLRTSIQSLMKWTNQTVALSSWNIYSEGTGKEELVDISQLNTKLNVEFWVLWVLFLKLKNT